MGYGVIAHEDERDNGFSKIVKYFSKYLLKTSRAVNTDLSNNELKNAKQPPLFLFTKPVISLLVGYDLYATSSQWRMKYRKYILE